MNRTFVSLALAGALSMAALPAFAQDIDLDPFHIFTPAPAAAPAAAPAPAAKKHHTMHHKMMKKPTTKKSAMKKPMKKATKKKATTAK